MSNLDQTGRHAADAAEEASENFKSAADSVSDTVGNYTSKAAEKARDIAAHFTRKAGKRYARARDAVPVSFLALCWRATVSPREGGKSKSQNNRLIA